MKIFSKKSFRFDKDGQKSVTVEAGIFSPELPDWIKDTLLYKLAVKEGSISEIAKKSDQTEIEKGLADSELAKLREQAKTLGIKNFTNMKQETLEAKIAEALKKAEDEKKANSGEDSGGNGNDDNPDGENNA